MPETKDSKVSDLTWLVAYHEREKGRAGARGDKAGADYHARKQHHFQQKLDALKENSDE